VDSGVSGAFASVSDVRDTRYACPISGLWAQG
jgi:hypothetical protein